MIVQYIYDGESFDFFVKKNNSKYNRTEFNDITRSVVSLFSCKKFDFIDTKTSFDEYIISVRGDTDIEQKIIPTNEISEYVTLDIHRYEEYIGDLFLFGYKEI